MKKIDTRALCIMGLLTALQIVLSRFLSINAWDIKLGFAFLPVVAAALMLGPIQGGIVAALGDFIGAVLFPIGPYFPGFTLTGFLTGLVYGICLRRRQGILNCAAAAGICQFLLGLVLNTYWISLLYGSPYWPLFFTRIWQCTILFLVELMLIPAVAALTRRLSIKKA